MLISRRDLSKKLCLFSLAFSFKGTAANKQTEKNNLEIFAKTIFVLTDFNIEEDLLKSYYYLLEKSEYNFSKNLESIYNNRVISNSKEQLNDLEKKIIRVMYSGVVDNKMVTFFNRLNWLALSNFTKPQGLCGGEFGFWKKKPNL